MGMYEATMYIYPSSGGEWTLDNGRSIRFCDDREEMGAYLEEYLWPLLLPLLNGRRDIKIIITEDDGE